MYVRLAQPEKYVHNSVILEFSAYCKYAFGITRENAQNSVVFGLSACCKHSL